MLAARGVGAWVRPSRNAVEASPAFSVPFGGARPDLVTLAGDNPRLDLGLGCGTRVCTPCAAAAQAQADQGLRSGFGYFAGLGDARSDVTTSLLALVDQALSGVYDPSAAGAAYTAADALEDSSARNYLTTIALSIQNEAPVAAGGTANYADADVQAASLKLGEIRAQLQQFRAGTLAASTVAHGGRTDAQVSADAANQRAITADVLQQQRDFCSNLSNRLIQPELWSQYKCQLPGFFDPKLILYAAGAALLLGLYGRARG